MSSNSLKQEENTKNKNCILCVFFLFGQILSSALHSLLGDFWSLEVFLVAVLRWGLPSHNFFLWWMCPWTTLEIQSHPLFEQHLLDVRVQWNKYKNRRSFHKLTNCCGLDLHSEPCFSQQPKESDTCTWATSTWPPPTLLKCSSGQTHDAVVLSCDLIIPSDKGAGS